MSKRIHKPSPRYSALRLIELFDADANNTEIAEALDIDRRTVAEWRKGRDSISLNLADVLAIRLGLHPLEVWGNSYFDGLD